MRAIKPLLLGWLALVSVTGRAQDADSSAPDGISFRTAFVAEGFAGKHNPPQYRGSFTSSATLDLARLRLGRGILFVSGQTVQGHVPETAADSPLQSVSNLAAPNFARFAEAWWAGSFFDDKLRLQAGRQYADGQFGAVESAGPFLNSSYGLIPSVPLPTYPAPQPGASVWLSLSSSFSVGAGLYRANPLEGLTAHGRFAISEIQFARASGVCRAGIWRQDHPDAPPRHGYYGTGERAVWHSRSASERRLRLFGQWGWTPGALSQSTRYTSGGLVFDGLAAGSLGAGLARLRLPGTHAETGLEVFYRWRVSRQISLQPDFQWLHHCGGSHRRSLYHGLRLAIEI